MKRTILVLSILLVLQIALVLGIQLTTEVPGNYAGGGKLLAFSQAQIDQLLIEGSDQNRIKLVKTDGQWRLPDHFGAPADAQKIDGLLQTLLDIERSWPVAKTDEALKRFKLAEENFERRLRFNSGDEELGSLLLGSSPGFRKVHARLADEQQAFDIPFSAHQSSLKNVDWVDKTVLQLKTEQISAIKLPDCRLTRQDGQPQLADLNETEQTDSEKARQLFERLGKLSIQDVHAAGDTPLPAPVSLSIELELADGKSLAYDFAEVEDKDYALLKTSAGDFIYKVSPSLLKELKETTRQNLVQVDETNDQPTSESQTLEDALNTRG